MWPYNQLLLTGDRAKDETFLDVVKDALWELGMGDEVEVRKRQMDPVWGKARSQVQRIL